MTERGKQRTEISWVSRTQSKRKEHEKRIKSEQMIAEMYCLLYARCDADCTSHQLAHLNLTTSLRDRICFSIYQMRKWESFSADDFCPQKLPSGVVAIHTDLQYCLYAKPRCDLVSFLLSMWRRAGRGFPAAAFSSVIQMCLPLWILAGGRGTFDQLWGESGPFLSGGGEGDGDYCHLEALRC